MARMINDTVLRSQMSYNAKKSVSIFNNKNITNLWIDNINLIINKQYNRHNTVKNQCKYYFFPIENIVSSKNKTHNNITISYFEKIYYNIKQKGFLSTLQLCYIKILDYILYNYK